MRSLVRQSGEYRVYGFDPMLYNLPGIETGLRAARHVLHKIGVRDATTDPLTTPDPSPGSTPKGAALSGARKIG